MPKYLDTAVVVSSTTYNWLAKTGIWLKKVTKKPNFNSTMQWVLISSTTYNWLAKTGIWLKKVTIKPNFNSTMQWVLISSTTYNWLVATFTLQWDMPGNWSTSHWWVTGRLVQESNIFTIGKPRVTLNCCQGIIWLSF